MFCWLSLNDTGAITPALGDLGSLTYLDVSSNSLDGDLPSELGTLSQLAHLAGANNAFTGNVPDVYTAFSALTYLDLSSNALSGMPEQCDIDGIGRQLGERTSG